MMTGIKINEYMLGLKISGMSRACVGKESLGIIFNLPIACVEYQDSNFFF